MKPVIALILPAEKRTKIHMKEFRFDSNLYHPVGGV